MWRELLELIFQALSEDSVVGPRANVFSPDKDGEAGDIGFIVDGAGCSQAENKPLEARSSFQTVPSVLHSAVCVCDRPVPV